MRDDMEKRKITKSMSVVPFGGFYEAADKLRIPPSKLGYEMGYSANAHNDWEKAGVMPLRAHYALKGLLLERGALVPAGPDDDLQLTLEPEPERTGLLSASNIKSCALAIPHDVVDGDENSCTTTPQMLAVIIDGNSAQHAQVLRILDALRLTYTIC